MVLHAVILKVRGRVMQGSKSGQAVDKHQVLRWGTPAVCIVLVYFSGTCNVSDQQYLFMKHFITFLHSIFTSKIVSTCVCDIRRNTGFSGSTFQTTLVYVQGYSRGIWDPVAGPSKARGPLEQSLPFAPLAPALCVSVQSIPVCDNLQDGKHLCFHVSVRQCVCERVYSVAACIVNIQLVRMLSICYQREKAHLFHFSIFLLVFPSSVTFSLLFDGCFYLPERFSYLLTSAYIQ